MPMPLYILYYSSGAVKRNFYTMFLYNCKYIYGLSARFVDTHTHSRFLFAINAKGSRVREVNEESTGEREGGMAPKLYKEKEKDCEKQRRYS